MQPRVVALGGGHGLAATLGALRRITSDITAIVTVADNGGSSGRLRDELPILPPGDLRMALAALCADDDWGKSWAEIMQYRFTSGQWLEGHPVGNLLLAALWDRDEDPVTGLDRVASLLKVVGRVLPMASAPLDIEGTFISSLGRVVVRGQEQVATAKGKLKSLKILPSDVTARPEAIQAIAEAEWITMGPGSWFSSVLPHLLVSEQRYALTQSKAKRIVLLNLDAHPNSSGDEFAGHDPEEHLNLIHHYAPEMFCDYVIADTGVVRNRASLSEKVADMGGKLIVADLSKAPGSIQHDGEKLVSVFGHIFGNTLIG